MANIRVDLDYTLQDGAEIKFRSPVDCSQVAGLIVYYPGIDGNITSKEFVLADAHGNNVGDIDHLFAEDVVVKVILDVTKGMAFVQNADTNAYLEAQLASKRPDTWMPTAAQVGAAPSSHNHSASDINSGKLSLAYGGTGQNLSNIPKGAVVRNSTDGTGLWYAAAKSGALYATAEETAPKFGTLPIAQGGTGATTAANAVSGLGIKDYVVQQGTKKIGAVTWTYRKWNSGIAECWCTETLSNFTTAIRIADRVCRSEEFANITFPFNFASIPAWSVTVTDLATSAGSGYFGGVIYLYGALVNSTGKYAVYSESPSTYASATAQHYVIGKY